MGSGSLCLDTTEGSFVSPRGETRCIKADTHRLSMLRIGHGGPGNSLKAPFPLGVDPAKIPLLKEVRGAGVEDRG
jgi:hypothetical protein